jgi:hypothetical protein
MGAAREHGILDALREAGVKVIVDHGYPRVGVRDTAGGAAPRRGPRDRRASAALTQPASTR